VNQLLYLSREEVVEASKVVNPVEVMRTALSLHAKGRTILPEESYLSWTTPSRGNARSIGMSAHLDLNPAAAVGAKIINANIANTSQGLPRASGVTVLFDPETARPVCVMHAAVISALRTAGVSLVALLKLRSTSASSVAVIGSGTIARTHLELLLKQAMEISSIAVFDLDPARAERLAEDYRKKLRPKIHVDVSGSAEDAIRDRAVVIAATTTTEGYIPYEWLAPGTVLINVSLDDALPDVVEYADLVVVDDWELVRQDHRRLLGRLYREGHIHGPHEPPPESGPARRVDASIGEVLIGCHPGRDSEADIILVNPFGMAIGDVAYSHALYQFAITKKLGTTLAFD
jgi:ornithine cyclodeaminase